MHFKYQLFHSTLMVSNFSIIFYLVYFCFRYEDWDYQIERLSSRCGLRSEMLTKSWYHRIGNISSVEVERQMFNQLPLSLVLRLSEIYYLDLIMFNYDIKSFLPNDKPSWYFNYKLVYVLCFLFTYYRFCLWRPSFG